MNTGLPTSPEIRLAIVRAFNEEGFTYAEIASLLGIGEATVSRVLRLHRETNAVAPRPRGGGNISPISGKVANQLKALVAATPDATLEELRSDLEKLAGISTSSSSMKRAMKRLGFSRKKRNSSPPSATRQRTSGGGESSPHS